MYRLWWSDVQGAVGPETVAPLVLWLSHETCKETGGVYEATAGLYSKCTWSLCSHLTVLLSGWQ